jgi:ribosomal protein S17E
MAPRILRERVAGYISTYIERNAWERADTIAEAETQS